MQNRPDQRPIKWVKSLALKGLNLDIVSSVIIPGNQELTVQPIQHGK